MKSYRFFVGMPALCLCVWHAALDARAQAQNLPQGDPRFVDHSLLIAPEYPCTWPAYPFPAFSDYPRTHDWARLAVQHRHTFDRRQHRYATGRAAAFGARPDLKLRKVRPLRVGLHRQDRRLAVRRRSVRRRLSATCSTEPRTAQARWSRPSTCHRFGAETPTAAVRRRGSVPQRLH